MNNSYATSKAKELAQQNQKTYAVILVDSGESRKRQVVEESYLDTDEFEAFDGRLEVLAYSDGSVEAFTMG